MPPTKGNQVQINNQNKTFQETYTEKKNAKQVARRLINKRLPQSADNGGRAFV